MTATHRPIAASLVVTVAVAAAVLLGGPGSTPGGAGRLEAAAPSPVLPDMVTPRTVKAIDKGLEYLARTQRADGSWLASGAYGGYNYPCAMSSLAGLALLSSGSTPENGQYAKHVKKAMMYVLRVGESHTDGLIAASAARSMYGHGFSMLFLAQCYGVDRDKKIAKRIRVVLDRAVKLTARAQSDLGAANNHAGGWIYTPSGRADEGSVTVTQLQALRACRNVGIKVPKSTIERAVGYLKYCQQSDGGICYSARSRGSSRPAISAAAITCFYSMGVYDRQAGGSGEEAKMVERLVEYCKRNVRVSQRSGHYFYTHFYMAQGMYMHGGADWKKYFPQIRDELLRSQSVDGSWNGDSVGTTYGTALATIILQLPYGYLPICQR